LLEAIAFPIVIENIMRGRLRGYYFNTFLLVAEHRARVRWQAGLVFPSLPAAPVTVRLGCRGGCKIPPSVPTPDPAIEPG